MFILTLLIAIILQAGIAFCVFFFGSKLTRQPLTWGESLTVAADQMVRLRGQPKPPADARRDVRSVFHPFGAAFLHRRLRSAPGEFMKCHHREPHDQQARRKRGSGREDNRK